MIYKNCIIFTECNLQQHEKYLPVYQNGLWLVSQSTNLLFVKFFFQSNGDLSASAN